MVGRKRAINVIIKQIGIAPTQCQNSSKRRNVSYMNIDNQPFITKTKSQRDEFFDSLITELDINNPQENERLSVQLNKDWVSILLPLLYMYTGVCNDYAMNSTPKCKEIFVQSVEIANKLICMLNQALIKNEPIVIEISYSELDVIVDTIELQIQLLKYNNITVEPILESLIA